MSGFVKLLSVLFLLTTSMSAANDSGTIYKLKNGWECWYVDQNSPVTIDSTLLGLEGTTCAANAHCRGPKSEQEYPSDTFCNAISKGKCPRLDVCYDQGKTLGYTPNKGNETSDPNGHIKNNKRDYSKNEYTLPDGRICHYTSPNYPMILSRPDPKHPGKTIGFCYGEASCSLNGGAPEREYPRSLQLANKACRDLPDALDPKNHGGLEITPAKEMDPETKPEPVIADDAKLEPDAAPAAAKETTDIKPAAKKKTADADTVPHQKPVADDAGKGGKTVTDTKGNKSHAPEPKQHLARAGAQQHQRNRWLLGHVSRRNAGLNLAAILFRSFPQETPAPPSGLGRGFFPAPLFTFK